MRAKMQVSGVSEHARAGVKRQETLTMRAVCASKYPEDGSDEDNTYAKFTPTADLSIQITNAALFDKFKVGDKFYVDFTRAE